MEASNLGKKLGTTRSLVPWLSFSYRDDKKMNTICTVSESICQNPQFIPELGGKKCLASYQEWLVLEDQQTSEICNFNVSSMRMVKLPRWSSGVRFCVLSSKPDDPYCRVLVVRLSDDKIMLCKPGDNEYTTLDWQIDDHNHSIWAATIFNGNLYCLLFPSYTLIAADVSGPTIISDIHFKQVMGGLPRRLHEEFHFTRCYLINVDNELLLVSKLYLFCYEEVARFKVYRANFSNMAWVEIKSIGDQTIFLDSSEGLCCLAADAGTRKNCIYSTESEDRRLYIFDLEDQSLMTSMPCPYVSRTKVDSKWILKYS